MDWLGEIDLEGLEPDEDFFQLDKKTGQASGKKLDGRLYLSITNQRALGELLRLWKLYVNVENLGHGYAKWRDLFDYTKDVRRWGAKDRLLDSNILDEWEECSSDNPEAKTSFRLELWFREGEAGNIEERAVSDLIISNGGEVTASCRIEGIHFHALKGRIPIKLAKLALQIRESDDESLLPLLFRKQAIRYFQPVAQGVTSLSNETEPFAVTVPPPGEQPPIVALLDGYPFARHDVLDGRLEIYDPEDLLSRYNPSQMRHGTAMASLIVNGELDAGEAPLARKIYCRPILEPDLGSQNQGEHIPETVFAEDRVHRAIVEMFEGETATAPTVCVVNLSIGQQPFDREISPWARLIDWLAWKYKLLFCVSAGNQGDTFELGIKESEFSDKSDEDKIQATLAHIGKSQHNYRLLSPGEAINALTVGAQHIDRSTIPSYLAHRVDLLPSQLLTSPISRLGPGFRRAIKPEILMPGGRQLFSYVGSNGCYKISPALIAPGQRIAAPDSSAAGLTNQTLFWRGTSNATALTSRAVARLYEVLEEIKIGTGGDSISRHTTAPLLKALLVHSASWPSEAIHAIDNAVPSSNKKRTRANFLGYGIADPSKVENCTKQRATVLGGGLLKQDEAHEYRLPLPVELSGQTVWRRMIITLAWLTPVNSKHRAYRKAKLSFYPPTKSHLPLDRTQADWQQVQKGTIQHEILEGDKIGVFQDGDSLIIKVSAQGDTAQDFEDEIPYGLIVTLEAEEQSGIPIYERIREKLQIEVKSQVNVIPG